jgi:hypothetical protein
LSWRESQRCEAVLRPRALRRLLRVLRGLGGMARV